MSIGDSLTLVSCLAGLMLALPGLMTVLNLTCNRTTELAAARLAHGAVLPFIVGLLPIATLGYLGFVLMSMGSLFQFFGALVILVLLAWMFTGLGVVARVIGLKLGQITAPGNSRFNRQTGEIILGAFVLTLAIAFPLLGWFLVLPVSWTVGVGGTVLALFERQGAPRVSTSDAQRFTPEHI